jgi:hypothetical protein
MTTNEVALVAKVTVTMDGRFEWTFDEPSWLPLSFGACLDIAYLWSARALIALRAFDVEPEKIEVDEDLLFVFHVDEGWVLVCETSVRRWVHGSETARLEFGEVIRDAAWVRDLLMLRDLSGAEAWVRVEGNQLPCERCAGHAADSVYCGNR